MKRQINWLRKSQLKKKDTQDEKVLKYHKIYYIICFEYALVPVQYFLDEMPLWDINDLIVGLSYKGRQEWERLRTGAYITIAPHCKKIDKNKMLPFPWDEKPDTSISNKDVDRMKALAKKFEKGA